MSSPSLFHYLNYPIEKENIDDDREKDIQRKRNTKVDKTA